MSVTRNLGGDRLGSGNKMNVNMHGFNRSNHDLSYAWRSSMAPGTLVPFMVEPILNGDTFDIDLNTLVRTLPTNGPIFGSFKMQMDVFTCPIRLYNAALHNNKLKIGMDMSKVKFPLMTIQAPDPDHASGQQLNQQQINSSSLLAYLGQRGLGKNTVAGGTIQRNITAMPTLMYWDIYKNYYANKQEEIGVVLGTTGQIGNSDTTPSGEYLYGAQNETQAANGDVGSQGGTRYQWYSPNYVGGPLTGGMPMSYFGDDVLPLWPKICFNSNTPNTAVDEIQMYCRIVSEEATAASWRTLREIAIDVNQALVAAGSSTQVAWRLTAISDGTYILVLRTTTGTCPQMYGPEGVAALVWSLDTSTSVVNTPSTIRGLRVISSATGTTDLQLKTFPLSNIDDMRELILKQSTTTPLILTDIGTAVGNMLPYNEVFGSITTGIDTAPVNTNKSYFPMNGLGIKTYQSDRFNNWLDTEWIDGAGGISEITAIDTSEGNFTIDTLNLAQKVYDMLNRIAVSGGSYVDWQEAVYGQNVARMAETPIYCGGASAEIIFNEVVSTAESGEANPLGSLAGRGSDAKKKGGTIRVKCNEPSYVIGIVSITPRIDYSQGNQWWTRLTDMDMLHKPSLDGIGFQPLLTDEMAAWDTNVTGGVPTYKSAGKQPAWIQYMTNVNRCYGEFAINNATMFMTLNRQYEYDENGNISDLTTYIDPAKYNYAFASTKRDSQNFWVQLGVGIFARRVMSQKIIPNL